MQELSIPDPRHIPKPLPRFEPKTRNQQIALQYLEEKQIVILTGSAGTGKSLLAAQHIAKRLHTKQVPKVFLARPAVAVGKSVGLLPGDVKEKLSPYFKQTLTHIAKFLGNGATEYALNAGAIEMIPVEYLRGMSFENCIVLAEEVQNFTAEEMEMMFTRLGENSQLIMTGDTKQHDLKGVSGLKQATDLIERMLQTHPEYMSHDDMDALDNGIGFVKFQPDDVLRGGLTKAFVKMYYHNKDAK